MRSACILLLSVIAWTLLSGNKLSKNTSFRVHPSLTNSETLKANQFLKSSDIYMKNISGRNLRLSWKRITNTLKPEWDYSMCEYGRCLASIPDSSTSKIIKAGEDGFIRFHLDPQGTVGKGEVQFKVWDNDDPSQYEILTFKINVLPDKLK